VHTDTEKLHFFKMHPQTSGRDGLNRHGTELFMGLLKIRVSFIGSQTSVHLTHCR